MAVLSIQSSVVYGHVGNSAAMPAWHRLAREAWPVDTVSFSNHPGHGRFRGRVAKPADLDELLLGLSELGLDGRIEAILSGYLGHAGQAAPIAAHVARVKRANPHALFLCDPVMGDAAAPGSTGKLFVAAGVPAAIAITLLPQADLLTPNRFELETLVGRTITTGAEARRAAEMLFVEHDALSAMVVTSFDGSDVPPGSIDTLAIGRAEAWRLRRPRIARRFDGAGDLFAALFLEFYLRRRDLKVAVEQAVSALDPVLRLTHERGWRELALVDALPLIERPPSQFGAEPL